MMTSGDIWSSGAFAFESPLKDLLDSLDYSLEDLLGEDELLQELRGLHPELITFFSSEENVANLVKCLVVPPPPFEEVMNMNMNFSDNDDHDQTGENYVSTADNDSDTEDDDSSQAESQGDGDGEAARNTDDQDGNGNENIDADPDPDPDAVDEGDQNESIDSTGDHNGNSSGELIEQSDYESEPEPDVKDLDLSRESIGDIPVDVDVDVDVDMDMDVDMDEIASPGKWLLENTTETLNGDDDPEQQSHYRSSLELPFLSSSTCNIQNREEYDNRYIRYPYMACEVICCEVTNILDIIVDGYVPIKNNGDESASVVANANSERESILDLLFSMLFNTPDFELDDRRAGYLEKILTVLFRKKRAELTAYINGDHLVESNLKSASGNHDDSDGDADGGGGGDADIDVDGGGDGGGDDTIEDMDSVKQENGDINEDFTNHKRGGPQLLEVLFKHLHSNSIAQIIQRLLMPKPPSAVGCSFDKDNDGDDGHHEDEDDEDEDELLHEMDDYGGINCDWADSEVGLKYLLDNLLVKPSGDDGDGDDDGNSDDKTISEEDEKILNASQHACEILTTIIQHSTLNSNIMIAMTGEPILSRLMECACGNAMDSSPSNFSMHDSTMTTAMNVLEILILQLGGYGTVPTSSQDNNEEQGFNSNSNARGLKEAEAAALIQLLPNFTSCLFNLLQHPETGGWQSHFQYSTRPQQMLGASRLRIVRLLESLVLLSIRDVDLILCGSECLGNCLDLFWAFPWCSMLHQSVANLLVHILEGGDERIDLQIYFLNRCNLPMRLMDSFESALFSCDDEEDGKEVEPTKSDGELSTVLAIKKLGNGGSESSSLDVEQGSEKLSQESDDIRPRIESEGKTEHETIQMNGESKAVESASVSNDEEQKPKKKITFRMGYMGHVIIICQALVHACGALDQGIQGIVSNEGNSDKPDTDTATSSVKNDDGSSDPLSESEHSRLDTSNEPTSVDELPPRLPPRNMILSLLRANRHYKTWINFVTTKLASETAVQSTPLGGFNAQEENAMEHMTESTAEESFGGHLDEDGDIGDMPESAVFGGSGDINLDDVDVDIAASIMESMNITPADENSNSNDSSQPRGHTRKRGVISGQGVGNGTSFGTVVEMHKKPDEYVYDDPLGARHHFDGDLNSDDSDSDEDPENNGDNENADGDDEAPVMDLFAGNFNFDKANIEADESDDAEGWANFDDGDFSSGIGEDMKEPIDSFDAQNDPFSVSDVFGLVANSANIMSSLDNIENGVDIPNAISKEEHANVISSLENGDDDIIIQSEEPIKNSEHTEKIDQ